MRQKHLYQQAGQPGEESFKLEMTKEGDDNPQSNKEVVDQPGKQMVQDDVDKKPCNQQNKLIGPT